ncbi:MAG TPA: hypothetical protein VG722_05960 [Tepidisphaeraceae bacterium]|nr:hypothetical protein [Tepidisphaeraceae bacterium]
MTLRLKATARCADAVDMLRAILFFGMVSGWALSAACVYVVRTPTGWIVMPKNSLSFKDTYADTRHWTADDLPDHRALVQRLISTNREEELSDVKGISGEGSKLKKRLAEAIEKASGEEAKSMWSRVFDSTIGG